MCPPPFYIELTIDHWLFLFNNLVFLNNLLYESFNSVQTSLLFNYWPLIMLFSIQNEMNRACIVQCESGDVRQRPPDRSCKWTEMKY